MSILSDIVSGMNPFRQKIATSQHLGNRDLNGTLVPFLDDISSRRVLYRIWWGYYTNNIYESEVDGGLRRVVNDYLSDARVGNIAGLFNPIQRVVDTYQLVFDGNFGNQIKIDEKLEDGKTPVNKAVPEALSKVWRWSNINKEKELLCRYTPTFGTCGIRIVAKNDPLPEKRRIYLKVEHPSRILDLEVDNHNNITQILLEYEIEEGDIAERFMANPTGILDDFRAERRTYLIREYMSKDKFWATRDDKPYDMINKVENGPYSSYENISGIVPYVLVPQNYVGSPFGLPSFYGHERKVDHLNALVAHINQQIRHHVTATWFLEAGGPPPDRIEIGDMTVVYVQKELGQTSSASMTPIVANLNLADAITQVKTLQEELQNSMPELKATDGQFLSHQSGGTVAQLRLPAEQRIMSARSNYEDALVRAQKIALSLGILYEVPDFDLGTGTGSREAADEAYVSGAEDHKFNDRPALPLTVDDELQIAKTEQALAAAEDPGKPAVVGGNNKTIPTSQKPKPSNVSVGSSGTVGTASSTSS